MLVRVDELVEIPKRQWYHLIDALTRMDELLELILKADSSILEALKAVAPLPAYVVPRQVNGKVGTTAQTVWEGTNECYSLLIHNTHSTQILYASFDGGTAWKKIDAGSTLELTGWSGIPMRFDEKMKLKGSAADTTYETIFLRTPQSLAGRSS